MIDEAQEAQRKQNVEARPSSAGQLHSSSCRLHNLLTSAGHHAYGEASTASGPLACAARKEILHPIPERAKRFVHNPTQAWQIASIKQNQRVLPLKHFTEPRTQERDTVRFVAISDTHGAESRRGPPVVPEGDVLLHAGDWTQTGRLEEIESFCRWFGSLPHKRKIIIAGNHDLSLHAATYAETSERFGHNVPDVATTCSKARSIIDAIPNCEYLCDSGTEVRGLRVWGSPWQPWFCDWAFNLERGDECRARWKLIPAGTDVVMTHGPALGYGDLCSSGERAGCLDLLQELQQRVRPAVHVFGHIHEGFGATTDGATTYLNASTCTLRYRPDNPALVFDLPARDGMLGGAGGPVLRGASPM